MLGAAVCPVLDVEQERDEHPSGSRRGLALRLLQLDQLQRGRRHRRWSVLVKIDWQLVCCHNTAILLLLVLIESLEPNISNTCYEVFYTGKDGWIV